MSTLPQTAFNTLPFAKEAMSQWKKDVDIITFVNALYDTPYPSSHGSEAYADTLKTMREYARSFTKNLMEDTQISSYQDFYQDAHFGQVAKYAISMKFCISRLLEDAGFYSLAHVLEAESDMECSLLLASHFYYKQATSMLRNILEEVFLPIYFCDNVPDYEAWKTNNFRTPQLRGNNGLIKRLLKKNIINDVLATRIADLYGNLSAYIHGSENTLIHQNIHLGEIHRVEYDQDMYLKWCSFFCECIEVCSNLLKINYDQWSAIRSSKFEMLAKVGKTLCHTCHNEDTFDRWLLSSKYCYAVDEKSNEKSIVRNVENLAFYCYTCKVCHYRTTVNANETPLSIIMCFSTDGLPSGSTITEFAHLVRGTKDSYCEWYTVQPEGADIITPLLVPA